MGAAGGGAPLGQVGDHALAKLGPVIMPEFGAKLMAGSRWTEQGQVNAAPLLQIGIPDTAYIPVYGEILGDVSERSYYEGDERAYSSYAAGYENFMKDAIRFVYRRGQREIANRMKNELATFEFANLNDRRRAQWLAQDIARFVQAEVADRLGREAVARSAGQQAVGRVALEQIL